MDQHPTPERLRQYLDGRLSESNSRQVEDHLAACADVCQLIAARIADGEEPLQEVGAATIKDQKGDSSSTSQADGRPTPNVPGYDILHKLGHGGMGVVYKALQVRANRLVALKMILKGAYAAPADRDRFKAEAEVLARLQHPHIVQVFEVGEHEGHPFFSMEYCSGGSLAAKLNGTPLESRRAAGRAETLARAVHAAHQARVIHRDLKPDNMLLAADDSLKIADFGLAKILDNAGLSDTGVVQGTPSYMAPEQVQAVSADLGPAVDVYALGAVLYEMLTGRPPFKATTLVDTLRQVLDEEPVAPSRLNVSIPRDLETICLKCLQKSPAQRYGSAADLADDLRRFQAGEPIKARPIGRLEHGWRWVLRNPLPAGLLAATVLLALGLLAGGARYLQVQAQTDHRKKLAEHKIRATLDQAHKYRAALHTTLQKPGGVFELLIEPKNWEAQITLAQENLQTARDLLRDDSDPLYREQAQALAALLAQDDKDRQFAVRLEKIRMDRATIIGLNFHDPEKAAEDYPQAFADAGLMIGKNTKPEAAAHIATSSIREQIVAALDDWAIVAFQLRQRPLVEQLLSVARHADPDPKWGDWIRRIDLWENQKGLEDKVKAGPVPGLSAPMLDLVAMLLWKSPALQKSWLRKAQAQCPGDFWLKLHLANALEKTSESKGEAVAYYWAAIGVQPRNSAAAYYNLGRILEAQNRLPEAIALYYKAIELDPNYTFPHNTLGMLNRNQKKLTEAIAEYRKAIAIDARYANAQYNLGDALFEQKKFPGAVAAYHKGMQLAPSLASKYRDNAVHAAALAGTGPGEDKSKFRQHAQDWLRAELDAYVILLKQGKADDVLRIKSRLAHWQTDADLAGVREEKVLAEFPLAERQSWQRLWADIGAAAEVP